MTTVDPDKWLSEMQLDTALAMFRENEVQEILFKVLPRNANSKNQVYLASDLSQLGKIPSGHIVPYESVSEKPNAKGPIFRAALSLSWLRRDGSLSVAPEAKLIAYPQFPEVRFSGFLQGCHDAPSSLFNINQRGLEPGRVLFFGIRADEEIIALVLPPESPAVKEIIASGSFEEYGALSILPLSPDDKGNGFEMLMKELCRIHRLDWIDSMRLDRDGLIVECKGTNCGGNTLEASLGIRSNGYAEPDFHGWEVKARTVKNISRPGASVVTLFTPEPSGGFYSIEGAEAFIHKYGYPDTRGKEDRINFGGVHRCNDPAHKRTKLRMILDGYNSSTGAIEKNGAIRLVDKNDADALSWSFAKLMDHWKRKHERAAYVPCEKNKASEMRYRYASQIQIGEGAQFKLFLKGVSDGRIYYDPGIKLEAASTCKPELKRRSQIRVSSKDLGSLYVTSRIVGVCL